MKMHTIRHHLLRIWLINMVVTLILFNFAAILQDHLHQESEQQALTAAEAKVKSFGAQWEAPSWQSGLKSQLAELNIGAVLAVSSGQERVINDNNYLVPSQPGRAILLTSSSGQVGMLELFAPPYPGTLWAITEALVLLFTQLPTILGLGWFLRRTVLNPLASMSKAARQIAGGELDVTVSASQVREVAEVALAFSAMGEGLREALQRQIELEQERRLFISAIAHDLRTPLFALRGHLEGLGEGIAATPQKIAQYVSVCQEQALVLEQRISDLFSFARLEYLEQVPRREVMEWRKLVEQSVTRFSSQAALKEVQIEVISEEPAVVAGDPQLLARVIENLMSNALRHTPPGGIVELSWHTRAGQLWFTVADSGSGIDLQDLPYLFTPLYRGEPSRSRSTGGAGLGLTIARRILVAHGGDLTATNRAKGGAEFTGWFCCPEQTCGQK
ncbi:MAG TPA: HAMP domain-containing sensor histidine kinase [Chloroflexia bacterium]|nr:HAMP domain-containing sensor histidine kinase [Chloroflexia bacterium]